MNFVSNQGKVVASKGVLDSGMWDYVSSPKFQVICEKLIIMNPDYECIIGMIKRVKPLKMDRIYGLIRKAQHGCLAARDLVINAYAPLVLGKAFRYCEKNQILDQFEDVYQDFMICLQELVMNYDLGVKTEFCALLGSRIGRVFDYYVEKSSVKEEMFMDHGYEEHIEEDLDRVDISKKIISCVDQLSEREAFVLECRWGLNGKEPETLEKIGEKIGNGISRERVRQIENNGIRHLRPIFMSAGLCSSRVTA